MAHLHIAFCHLQEGRSHSLCMFRVNFIWLAAIQISSIFLQVYNA